MTILNILLIGFIIVYIIDYSGFIEEMDKNITKVLKSPVQLHIPKPFSCSTCLTWWTGLLYILLTSNFTIPYVAAVALISALTPELLSILYFVKDAVNKAFISIEDFFNIKDE